MISQPVALPQQQTPAERKGMAENGRLRDWHATSIRVVSLAPTAQLHYDARRDCWVLLGPDCVLALDPVAHAVIIRLNGRHTIGQIVLSLAREYDAAPEVIAADIDDLLSDLSRRRLVRPDC